MPEPESPSLPIPLRHWFTNVAHIENLRKILDDEAFQTAVATLKEVAGPTHGAVSSDPSENSHRHAWYAGYRDAFNDLHKMTVVKSDRPNQQIEWNHIQTPPQ